MGSPVDEQITWFGTPNPDEDQHQVKVSGFYMSKFPVTQEQYASVMGYNDSTFPGANNPVEMVTWYDAVEFCNRLSEREGFKSVYTITNRVPPDGSYPITSATVEANWGADGYRLPTEAEWEYACRAGTTTAWNTGANIDQSQANFSSYYGPNTTPVGKFDSNRWGLYDMHGNVWEWCWDWYTPGSVSVVRGGSWFSPSMELRSAFRSSAGTGSREDRLGFRLVRCP